MGHAEHFLNRVERLAGSDVELALELYRDPELVRKLLEDVELPGGAERVAISLGDAVLGPFIVVTQDGHFVTCLGRGMRPGDLPVVTRVVLDGCVRRVARLRTKLSIACEVGAEQRETVQLLRRLFLSPDSISREDFLEIAAWEPLMGTEFLNTYLAMGSTLLEQGQVLRRVRLPKHRRESALRDYWNLLHAAGHMALLGSMTAEPEHYAALTEGQVGARAALSYPLTGTGVVTFVLKGAWAAGRLGKLMLPAYKKALGEDVAFFELLDTLFALLALGRRSRGLRAEIKKALRAAPGRAHTSQARRLRADMGDEVAACCGVTAGLLGVSTEEMEDELIRLGETYFESGDGELDDPVRRDLARTIPLMSRTDGITDGRKVGLTLNLIAASARGAPEQFYLPRDILSELREPWEPEDTWNALEPIMKVERARRVPTVRTSPKVGRNAPCPCGSGKKYKKCCGAGSGSHDPEQ